MVEHEEEHGYKHPVVKLRFRVVGAEGEGRGRSLVPGANSLPW